MAIDPTARVAAGARIGEGVEIGPYCLVGPQVELGRRRAPHRATSTSPASRRSAKDRRLSVLLARNAAAIGPLSRRGDATRHRRALRTARGRHHEHRDRRRRRRDPRRRALLLHGGFPCRARLPGRQRRDLRQQRRARRPCHGRRSRFPRRPRRGPSIRADRRGRHDGGHVGAPRRHHSVRICARSDRGRWSGSISSVCGGAA